MNPTGLRAGEDELTSGWLPARIWESRYLVEQLIGVPTRDLRFTGPVIPLAVAAHAKAAKVPEGWSVTPPYRIDNYPIRSAPGLDQYLTYLPSIFAPAHVTQLVQLVDELCPPAPTLAPRTDE